MVANRLVSVYGASPARHFDVRLGNPHNLSLAGCRGRAIQIRAANEFAQTVLPVIRAIQVAGTTSLASIADVLNERGIKSARGGTWHVSSLRGACNFAGLLGDHPRPRLKKPLRRDGARGFPACPKTE